MCKFRQVLLRFTTSRVITKVAMLVGAVGAGSLALAPEFARWPTYLAIGIAVFFCILLVARHFSEGVGIEELAGSWHSYHLTRDAAQGTEPYWVLGHFEFNKHSNRLRIKGFHKDTAPARNQYRLTGHLDGATLLLLERNRGSAKDDDCVGFFNNRQYGDRLIFGFWLGANTNNEATVGPYILSRDSLDIETLNRYASANKILNLEANNGTAFYTEA